MQSIYYNIRTERQYKASTGLSKREFEQLLVEFSVHYEPSKAEEHPYLERLILRDKGESLFFILHYLKTNPTYENLGLYFNISQASACNYVKLLIPILLTSLKKLNVVPLNKITDNEELHKLLSSMPECFAIDVSEIAIERPENEELQKKTIVESKKTIP